MGRLWQAVWTGTHQVYVVKGGETDPVMVSALAAMDVISDETARERQTGTPYWLVVDQPILTSACSL